MLRATARVLSNYSFPCFSPAAKLCLRIPARKHRVTTESSAARSRSPGRRGPAPSRNAIGWVIVGGIGLSTLLTTLVVPALYVLIGGYTRPANYTAELLDRMREGEDERRAKAPHPAE
jgi:hypothetical protein